MFEDRTEKILKQYETSKKLLQKLHTLVDSYEYGKENYNTIFPVVKPNLLSFSGLDFRAHEALADIARLCNIKQVPKKYRALYTNYEITVKEHAKAINKITPEIFYYNAFYYEVYNKKYNRPASITIDKNTIQEKSSDYDSMILFLNCIYLLDNPEPITDKQSTEIYLTLKKSNTFIFNGCKVTLYQNGKLIIKFSNSELFKRFEKKANDTIKQIQQELKKEA